MSTSISSGVTSGMVRWFDAEKLENAFSRDAQEPDQRPSNDGNDSMGPATQAAMRSALFGANRFGTNSPMTTVIGRRRSG